LYTHSQSTFIYHHHVFPIRQEQRQRRGRRLHLRLGRCNGQFLGHAQLPVDQSQLVEDLEKENANLTNRLDDALVQIWDTLSHAQSLSVERDNANDVESTARAALEAFRKDFTQTMAENQKRMEELKRLKRVDQLEQDKAEDYNRIGELQDDITKLKGTVDDQRRQLLRAEEEVTSTRNEQHQHGKDVAQYKQQIESLHSQTEALQDEVTRQKKEADEVDRHLNLTYAELEHVRHERSAIAKDKDGVEADYKELELQFQGLHKQWEEAQARVDQLEGQQGVLDALAKSVTALESDVERLQATIAEHDRTVIVKDERIAHLETQYQKERARNLGTAEAAAAAATAPGSPTDAPPAEMLSLDNNLQDELGDAYDEDGYEHLQHLELSDVAHLVDIAPTEPARPDLTILVTEAGSVTPRARHITTTSTAVQTDAPHAQALTTKLFDTATIDISPVDRLEAEVDTNFTQTETPRLTSNIVKSASVALSPIETATQKLSTRMIDSAAFGFSPVEPQHKPATPTKQNMDFGDIKVVLDEQPVDPRPSAATKTSTVSTAAQTTQTSFETATTIPHLVTPKRNKIGLLQAIFPIATFLLAITCLHLYIQLDSWRYANGIGYKFSNTGRTGAFGSGHNLFGFIPIATNMEAPWWEVQLSRYLRVATKSLEDWAGIDTRPLY